MQGSTLISQFPMSEKCRLKLFPAVLKVGSDLFWLETRSEHLANSSLSLRKVPEQLGKKAEGQLKPRTDSILSHRGGHVFLRGAMSEWQGREFLTQHLGIAGRHEAASPSHRLCFLRTQSVTQNSTCGHSLSSTIRYAFFCCMERARRELSVSCS